MIITEWSIGLLIGIATAIGILIFHTLHILINLCTTWIFMIIWQMFELVFIWYDICDSLWIQLTCEWNIVVVILYCIVFICGFWTIIKPFLSWKLHIELSSYCLLRLYVEVFLIGLVFVNIVKLSLKFSCVLSPGHNNRWSGCIIGNRTASVNVGQP